MLQSGYVRTAGMLAGLLMALMASPAAFAGPVSVVGESILSTPTSAAISEVRYRRPVRRRSGVGPGAVLGLFGAVLGGVIANQNYNNYSNYSYGQPYDYGYAPGYVSGPSYVGGGRASFGGRRGGPAMRAGGGTRGGGMAHGGGLAHGGGAARGGGGHPGKR